MDNEARLANRLVDFVSLIERILHEGALPLFRIRAFYPIDEGTLMETLEETIALFDHFSNIPLSLDQLSLFSLDKGTFTQIGDRLSFYEGLSNQNAIDQFLSKITLIVENKARNKASSNFFLSPDYRPYSSVVMAFLSSKV